MVHKRYRLPDVSTRWVLLPKDRRTIVKVYLASPYGFTQSGVEYLHGIRALARDRWKVELLDPWGVEGFDYAWCLKTASDPRAAKEWNLVGSQAPGKNFEMIRDSDLVVAVLDGSDVDSGVACEIGYAFGRGIPVIGYRSDFRSAGDSIHSKINIQVGACVQGEICTNWREVGERLCARQGGKSQRPPARSADLDGSRKP